MTSNPSFQFAEQLPKSHHLAGFATYSSIFTLLEDYCCFHVTNQKQASDYRKDLPHRLVFEFEFKEHQVPAPFYQFEIAIELDPQAELWEQVGTLSHCSKNYCEVCDETTVTKRTYRVVLGQFLKIYPALLVQAKDTEFNVDVLSFLEPVSVTDYTRSPEEEEEEEEVEEVSNGSF